MVTIGALSPNLGGTNGHCQTDTIENKIMTRLPSTRFYLQFYILIVSRCPASVNNGTHSPQDMGTS